jgi:hypothetical protein
MSFHIIEFYASKDMKNIDFEDDGIKISANLSQQTNNVYFCAKLKDKLNIMLS